MSITVLIRATLGDFWGTDDDFATMSDEQIIELCHEDISSLTDEATWTIERTDSAPAE